VGARFPVITGLGIATAAGIGVESVWQAVQRGASGLRALSVFSSPRHGPLPVGEIPEDLDSLGVPRRGSRSDRLAWLASRDALQSSGLDLSTCGDRAGMFLGCSVGGSFDSEHFLEALIKHGRMRPRATRFHECASAVQIVGEHFGLFGPSLAIATACSSGALAIAAAADLIMSGDADVMLAGGADSLSRMTWGGFHSLLLVDGAGCRPFDTTRAGMTLGEGAALLVIEAEENARARGATILARLNGWGASCDAHHATAPDPTGAGALAAMQRALARAGLTPAAINYVNAHGTGTRDNDLAESKALRTLFGAEVPPFSSVKRIFGHTLAASGAIEAVVCVEALRRQQLPPNPGFGAMDPEIGIAPVTESRPAKLTHVLSNSFGFGGNNAALIFSTATTTPHTRAPEHRPLMVAGFGVIAPGPAALRDIEPPLPAGQILAHSCGKLEGAATLTPNQRRRLCRMVQMALLAARRAQPPKEIPRTAVVMGTGFGCLEEGAAFIENQISKDEREPMPARFPGSVHNAPAAQIAIDLGARGLNSAPTCGEITFEAALWHASAQLQAGEADVALAGAVDELNKYPLAMGKRWGLWTDKTCPGEAAVVARLTCEKSPGTLATLRAIRLGRYRLPFDAEREADWISSAVDLSTVEVLVSGAGGWPRLEARYQSVAAALNARVGRTIEHQTYKQHSGEFYSASALGFATAVELARQRGCGVLLHTLSARGWKSLCWLQP